jgi:hypothetical protein
MAKLFYLPQAVRVDSTGAPYPGAKANFYLTTTTTRTDTYDGSDLGTPLANPVVADAAGQFVAIYLDPAITYRVILTEADNTQIDDVDPISVPLNADSIAFDDSGGDFTATDVDAALTEIGDEFAQFGEEQTWTASQTFDGASLDMQDNGLIRPRLRDFAIVSQEILETPSNTVTLDWTNANSFYHLLTDDVSTFNISNPPQTGVYGQCSLLIQQDGAGGAYTFDFSNENCLWVASTPPVITTANDAYDLVTFATIDAGTTYFCNFAQAYGPAP